MACSISFMNVWQLIRQQAERINEMTSIMYKAVNVDDNSDARKEEELYQRLITENKVFRC